MKLEIDNIFDSTVHFNNVDTKIRSIMFCKEKDYITADVTFKNREKGEYKFNLRDNIVDPLINTLKEVYLYFYK